MASAAEEEADYESDPEEVKRSLGMRRWEASDDEGEGGGGDKMRTDRRAWIHSDEFEGQGGVGEYDDDNEELDSEDVEEDEEADEENSQVEERIYNQSAVESRGSYRGGLNGVTIMREELEGDGKRLMEASPTLSANLAGGEEEKDMEGNEKSENEPCAVPTAGAFYMHDDRFRDNNAVRHRRMRGGRRLWESTDKRRWGHDKFEELSLQERHNEGRRTSKGHYRGQQKVQGPGHGYARGNRFRDREYNYNDNQSHAPKSVKGRGPNRYEPMVKNNRRAPSSQSKSGKHTEKVDCSAEKTLAPTSTVETKTIASRKQVFASSLNSASPPFYPSGSSSKGIIGTQNKDVQSVSACKNLRKDESFSMHETNSLISGKSIVQSVGNDRLYNEEPTDEPKNLALGKPLMNLQMQLPRSSTVNYSQAAESKTQNRGHITGPSYESGRPPNQFNRISSSNQQLGVQQRLVHGRSQHAMHGPGQQFGQHPGSISQTSSRLKSSLTINSFDGETESPSESTTLKGALVGNGKGTAQGNGRGSFLLGGSQVMGGTGSMRDPGDPNFPATPAFLPVMQFGGQHPGGIPAVGMAFPGYVAQPKLGLGNSEMTWLPVLTGAGGGPLGGQYCSSYIAVDGSYNSRPPGQILSAGTLSNDDATNKPNNEWKPSKKPDTQR